MNRVRKLIVIAIAAELVAGAVLIGMRLDSTRPIPPHVEQYNDAVSGRELLRFPDRFLFDGAEKWVALGEVYMAFGYFAKADACLSRAAVADPQSADIEYYQGYCLERLGRIGEARDAFLRAAVRQNSRLAESAWYHAGRNELQLEQPEDAAGAFEKAGDDHFPSVYQRAKLLIRAGRAEEAGPLLERLADNLPQDLHVWQLRAQAAALQGQMQLAAEARDAIERATPSLALDEPPASLAILRERLGMAREIAEVNQLQRSGQTAEAARRLSALVQDDTRWQNKYMLLLQDAAALQLLAGNAAPARGLLVRQIETQGFPTARAWDLLGDVEILETRTADAWRYWDRAARMQPSAVDHLKLARYPRPDGDAAALREVALAGQFAGMAAYRANQLEEARETLRRVAKIDAELPNVWFYLGQTERLLGDARQARAAYRRCLKLDPDHGRALGELARLTNSIAGPENE